MTPISRPVSSQAVLRALKINLNRKKLKSQKICSLTDLKDKNYQEHWPSTSQLDGIDLLKLFWMKLNTIHVLTFGLSDAFLLKLPDQPILIYKEAKWRVSMIWFFFQEILVSPILHALRLKWFKLDRTLSQEMISL